MSIRSTHLRAVQPREPAGQAVILQQLDESGFVESTERLGSVRVAENIGKKRLSVEKSFSMYALNCGIRCRTFRTPGQPRGR